MVTLAIILTVILISPMIPIQSQDIVTKTKTRGLKYDAALYIPQPNDSGIIDYTPYDGPPSVNVTNQDSIGGNFSVTIEYGSHLLFNGSAQIITFSQSIFINAGETKTFTPPSGWGGPLTMITHYYYSVSAPTIQENYNVTETKTRYKSILNSLFR
jgi:hypothetical protein